MSKYTTKDYILELPKIQFDFMQGMFKEGMSGAKVQQIMTDAGMGLRKETILAARRLTLDFMRKEELWARAAADKLPTKGYFNEVNYSAPFQYWIHYRVTGVDALTGEETEHIMSAFANSVEAKIDWEDFCLGQLNPEYYKSVEYFHNLRIVSVDHKAGQPY